MKNNKETLLKDLFSADVIVPMLLSAAVISSAAYIYLCGSASAVMIFAGISLFIAAFLFLLYEVLRRYAKTWLTVIAVGILGVLTVYAGNLLTYRDLMTEVAQWFMEPSKFTRIYYNRTLALILTFGFVLISCLYYFTRVRYRGVFVFLICLCPFALFAKTFTDIPVIFPIIIMTLFFFIMTGNSGKNDEEGNAIHTASESMKGARSASVAFVIAVTMIASFFPKMEFAPFRENFDEFVTGVSIGAAGAAADFSDFSSSSSNTTSNDEDTVVFYIRGDNPVLIKRQCFNTYHFEENTWGYYGNSENGRNNGAKYMLFEDPALLYEAVGYEGGETETHICGIAIAEGNIHAVYTSADMTGLRTYLNDVNFYRTELDEYFVSHNDVVTSYIITWSSFDIDTGFEKLFTDNAAEEISVNEAVTSYMHAKEDAEKYNEYLLSESVMDSCYSTASGRSRVAALAESITAGLDSTYDKARAIEKFFLSGEYIYDKNFTPADPSPDNFILNTKRGACASYATAMTLMCRELGMTARYCEGFWVQKRDNSGMWYVTIADSHAFVQVWIDGYGWTDFNPTSTTTDGGYFDPTFVFVGIFAACAALIGLLVIYLRPKMAEATFVRKMKAARGSAQKSMIYGKINGMINSFTGKKVNTLTPTDTAEICHSRLGYDIGGFIDRYESSVYGGIGDENEDCSDVYTGFAAAYKETVKAERKRKNEYVHGR